MKAALKFCEIHLKLISRTKRASFFFFSPETISKGDDIKIKRIVSPFFFPLPLYLAFTAVLSLFLARLHGLKAALKFCEIHLKLISRTKRASFFFFSPETISKGDDIKIKRIVSPFFFPLPLYLAFTAVLSLFLARLLGDINSNSKRSHVALSGSLSHVPLKYMSGFMKTRLKD